MVREQESLEQSSLKMFFEILISEKQIRTCKPQSLRNVHLLHAGGSKISFLFPFFGFRILHKPLDVFLRQNSNGGRGRHGPVQLFPLPIRQCLAVPSTERCRCLFPSRCHGHRHIFPVLCYTDCAVLSRKVAKAHKPRITRPDLRSR